MSKRPRCVSLRPGTSLAEENQAANFSMNLITQQSKQANEPQRIYLPVFFNTPIRRPKVKQMKESGDTTTIHNLEKSTKVKRLNFPEFSTALQAQRRLRDYEILAIACRRAGKIKDEGRAYYSIGVLYDNLEQWHNAIKYYDKFLRICKQIDDIHGQSLAYNCIGVDYQFLAKTNPRLIEKAIQYHKLHEELADNNGKFIASINLGLCYEDDQEMSMKYYQIALDYAVNVKDLMGQSLAIGNIGKIGQKGLFENNAKMKFLDKYIELAQILKNPASQVMGHLKLGTISTIKGNFVDGKSNFQKALNMVDKNREQYSEAKCGYAINKAEMQMDQYLKSKIRFFK